MTSDSFQQSLWSALTPELDSPPPASGSLRADVAIVGGGLLGLSSALHLAEAGTSVIVLESHAIGFGASGRNTGFVVPSLKGSLGLGEATALVGSHNAQALLRMIGAAGTGLFELVRRRAIECAAEQTGCLQPTPNRSGLDRIERQVRDCRALGIALEALDAGQILAASGIPGYFGALRFPTGGQINPLALVRGLASSASAAGARLYRGHAASIERNGGAWRLCTADGAEIHADTVILTTNALVGELMPRVRRSLIAAKSYQVATQPLDPEVRQRILPGRQPLVDLRNHPFAVRWSPDHRLVTGGGALFGGRDAVARMSRFLLRRLDRLVPGLPTLHAAHAWHGVIAGTGDFMPRFWRLGSGLYAPIGCNGRGVALTTALGGCIARYLTTGDAGAMPIPLTEPTPWKLHGLMRFAPALWLAQSRLKDWKNDLAARRETR